MLPNCIFDNWCGQIIQVIERRWRRCFKPCRFRLLPQVAKSQSGYCDGTLLSRLLCTRFAVQAQFGLNCSRKVKFVFSLFSGHLISPFNTLAWCRGCKLVHKNPNPWGGSFPTKKPPQRKLGDPGALTIYFALASCASNQRSFKYNMYIYQKTLKINKQHRWWSLTRQNSRSFMRS